MILRTTFALTLALAAAASAQTLTKLHDFSGATGAAWNPYDTPTYIDGALYFTAQTGGNYSFGALAKYDIQGNTVTKIFGELDVVSGNTPLSSFTREGNLLFYTNSRGGLADKGTLSVFNLADGSNTTLYGFPNEGPTSPATLHGNVTVVPRSGGLMDLYYNTQGNTENPTKGGGWGTVSKMTYNPATNAITDTPQVLHTFLGGDLSGRQPFEGGTRVGDTLYLTTFAGGPASEAPNTNAPNGGGWLYKVNLNTDEVSPLVSMPTTSASTVFPGHNPTYDLATNSLYFTTTGSTTRNGVEGGATFAGPGAVMKYDLTTSTLSTLGELSQTASGGPFTQGRFAYGPISIYEGFGYYTTIQGGSDGGGTINRISLASGEISTLFNLNSNTGNNFGGESRGGFVMVPDDEVGMHFYLMPRQGGVNDKGTILDMYVVPEPASVLFITTGVAGLLALRRRQRAPQLS